jgi:hypothetical protein
MPAYPAPVLAKQNEMTASPSSSPPIPRAQASHSPRLPQHVFLIVLENESYEVTFGATSAAYLKTLARDGVLLTHYYGIGHQSLGNYITAQSVCLLSLDNR